VLDICGNQIKIGISAPREILVLRSEVRLTAEANRLAARSANPSEFANLARKFQHRLRNAQ
jgi:carbon storage regulator CsrA